MRDLNVEKLKKRKKLKRRIRKKVNGTSERPRLTVYRSLKNIIAQLVDDENNRTLLTVSSLHKDIQESTKKVKGKVEMSKAVGKKIAEKAQENKIESVVFDRGGYKYHGRIKALAEGAREGGLKF